MLVTHARSRLSHKFILQKKNRKIHFFLAIFFWSILLHLWYIQKKVVITVSLINFNFDLKILKSSKKSWNPCHRLWNKKFSKYQPVFIINWPNYFHSLIQIFFLNKKNEILFIVPNCIKNGLFFLKIQKKKRLFRNSIYISKKQVYDNIIQFNSSLKDIIK